MRNINQYDIETELNQKPFVVIDLINYIIGLINFLDSEETPLNLTQKTQIQTEILKWLQVLNYKKGLFGWHEAVFFYKQPIHKIEIKNALN